MVFLSRHKKSRKQKENARGGKRQLRHTFQTTTVDLQQSTGCTDIIIACYCTLKKVGVSEPCDPPLPPPASPLASPCHSKPRQSKTLAYRFTPGPHTGRRITWHLLEALRLLPIMRSLTGIPSPVPPSPALCPSACSALCPPPLCPRCQSRTPLGVSGPSLWTRLGREAGRQPLPSPVPEPRPRSPAKIQKMLVTHSTVVVALVTVRYFSIFAHTCDSSKHHSPTVRLGWFKA